MECAKERKRFSPFANLPVFAWFRFLFRALSTPLSSHLRSLEAVTKEDSLISLPDSPWCPIRGRKSCSQLSAVSKKHRYFISSVLILQPMVHGTRQIHICMLTNRLMVSSVRKSLETQSLENLPGKTIFMARFWYNLAHTLNTVEYIIRKNLDGSDQTLIGLNCQIKMIKRFHFCSSLHTLLRNSRVDTGNSIFLINATILTLAIMM